MSVKNRDAQGRAALDEVPPSRHHPAGLAAASEGRLAPRKDVVGHGAVRIPGYRMSLPCRVVNTSATGARLELVGTNASHLPDRIVVVFTADRTEIDATIQWRTATECGVHFVSLFRRQQSRGERT